MNQGQISSRRFKLLTRIENLVKTSPQSPMLCRDARTITVAETLDWIMTHQSFLEESSLESGAQYGLPLILDDSLDAYLTTLACLVLEIPFSPIDSRAPLERVVSQFDTVGNPRIGVDASKGTNEDLFHYLQVARIDEFRPSHWPGSVNDSPRKHRGITIFSSGSTGKPKGVLVPFSMLSEQLASFSDEFDLPQKAARISAMAPLHVSGAIKRLLRALLGAEIHIISPREHSLKDLVEQLRTRKITHLHIPPQIARLIGAAAKGSLPFLPEVTHLKCGSEPIRFETLSGLRNILDDSVKVHHGLSATEGYSGIKNNFSLGSIPETGLVPIGLPSRQSDLRLEPVDGDVEGVWEVYVSGPIATGYANDPELTRERFFVGADGRGWWRSGDLVTRNSDGLFEHYGRKDDLVKIRGMLSSPSEASRAILGLEGIANAVVVPFRESDNVRLVAHFERNHDSQITVQEMRKHLTKLLPSHLVPAVFIEHDKLPTTARGKVDRSKLIEANIPKLSGGPVHYA